MNNKLRPDSQAETWNRNNVAKQSEEDSPAQDALASGAHPPILRA